MNMEKTKKPRASTRILIVFGTRPEAIKLAPLVKAFATEPAFDIKVCVTGQHRELLDQVLEFFNITPDFDLDLMTTNQTLSDTTVTTLKELERVIDEVRPNNIVVQGDTTTAMVGALAGFYSRVDVTHIEAGLRSHDMTAPFPEEGNRRLISQLTKFHFTPTTQATANLRKEGITQGLHQVGNTGVDALMLGLKMLQMAGCRNAESQLRTVDFSKRIILVTCHQRENFGAPLHNICEALRLIVEEYPSVNIVFPLHPNPHVREEVQRLLGTVSNIVLLEPLSYPALIILMSWSYMIVTDSGGIQEDAPSLGKPVLILRNVTERVEGVASGNAILVGTKCDMICREVRRLLQDEEHYMGMAEVRNPYGDGTASEQVVAILKGEYGYT
jgi:UDP-N-acetylglucosamine 2-epimerase (non-hydrolysing)